MIEEKSEEKTDREQSNWFKTTSFNNGNRQAEKSTRKQEIIGGCWVRMELQRLRAPSDVVGWNFSTVKIDASHQQVSTTVEGDIKHHLAKGPENNQKNAQSVEDNIHLVNSNAKKEERRTKNKEASNHEGLSQLSLSNKT